LQHETPPAPDSPGFCLLPIAFRGWREKKGGKGDKRAQIKGRDSCLLRRVNLRVVTVLGYNW